MTIPDYLHGIASDTLNEEYRAAHRSALWAVVLGVIPQKDGNQWCCLCGDNLQVGIAGFGDTPSAAMMAFEHQMDKP